MDPITLLSAFIPLVSYLGKRSVDKIFGAEIKQDPTAEAEKLKALATMEPNSADLPQWVNSIRGLQRPIVVMAVLVTWVVLTWSMAFNIPVNMGVYYIVCNIASSVMFYLFGDRTMMYIDQNVFKNKK